MKPGFDGEAASIMQGIREETAYEIGALDGASLKKLTTKKGKQTVSWEW